MSKFSKLSLFSGLNNLADITLDDLSRIVAADTLLSTSDVDSSPVEAPLLQAGYLTIASVQCIPS